MESAVTYALVGGGLLFALLGVLVIVTGVRRQRQATSWPEVRAEVVSLAQERRVVRPATDRQPETTQMVLVCHYRFTDPATGRPVEGSVPVSQQFEGGPGSPITLLRDPDDPARVMLPGSTSPVASGLFGIAFIVIGLAAALMSIKLGVTQP